jgi:hypothetical protein
MRISQTVLPIFFGIALGTFSTAAHPQAAQAVPESQQAPAAEPAPAPAPAPPAVTASSLLQPALTQAQSTLSAMKIDKWKKGSVRDEAGQNITALLHDLQSNIPPLMTAADAEPAALSRAIPLMKHLDAFYDVLLRVEEASRVSAPAEQVTALQQTMLDVNKARNAYDDQMQVNAVTYEKQVFDLQAQLRAQQDSAAQARQTAAAAPPCKPATTPARKKKRTTPSSSTSTTPSSGTPAPSQPQ